MKNIFINKGNYSLETPEREAEFERRRGAGWREEYAAYRHEWTDRPKRGDFGEWPLLVDLELSSVCNLKCPMCYTITEDFKKKVQRGFMPFELFCRIIDEIAPHVPAIRLSLRGEPTLHPQFLECVRYAKKRGVKEVSFLTNAGTLEEPFVRELILAGADWITVSLDGMGEVYEDIRKPLRFEETVERLKMIRKIRERLSRERPVVKIQGIWPALKDTFAEYYNFFSPHVDLIAFNPLIDYLSMDDETLCLYEEDFLCVQLYQRLVVASDGIILPCSNDENNTLSLGNIENTTIHEIWHGTALHDFRRQHAQQSGFMRYKTCRHCYLPRKTEGAVQMFPDGRSFIVKNYINRVQNIGQ